jgi:PAS domain S-box-containing protein
MFSIKYKMVIVMMALALLIIVITSLSGYYLMLNIIRQNQTRELNFIAHNGAQILAKELSLYAETLQRAARNRIIRDYYEYFREHSVVEHFSHFHKYYPILSVVTKEGVEDVRVMNGDSDSGHPDYKINDIFKLAKDNPNRTVFDRPIYYPLLPGMGIQAGIYLKSYFDTFQGAVAGVLPVANLLENLKSLQIGDTGYFIVLDNDKRVIASTNPEIALSAGKPDKPFILNLQYIKSGIMQAKILAADCYYAASPVSMAGLHVAAVLPEKEFLIAPGQLRDLVLMLGVICLLIGAGITWLLANTITKPIEQLTSMTKAVAAGNYEHKLNITSKDEIGVLASGFNQMIMEINKSRDALTNAKDYVERIIDSMSDCLIVLDPAGEISLANPAALALLGYGYQEIIGMEFDRIIGSSKKHDARPDLMERLVKETISQMECRFQSKRGDRIPMLFSSSVLRDKSGEIEGVVCLGSDMTQIKQAEKILRSYNVELERKVQERTERLDKTVEALQQEVDKKKVLIDELHRAMLEADSANRAKTQLLANVSHELRTPLTHIMGFTELIEQGHIGGVNEEQKELLGHILQSSDHLRDLISNLLDISKIEAGGLQIIPDWVRVDELLGACAKGAQLEAGKKGVDFKYENHATYEVVWADALRLNQVLQNLAGNAIKFTPPGGSIVLTAHDFSGAANRQGETHNHRGGWLEITMVDTGIGLAESDLERIFEPFVQADSAANRQFEGAGLGLSLVRKIVELHGGRIWAQSGGPGQGASFRFTVPAGSKTGGA